MRKLLVFLLLLASTTFLTATLSAEDTVHTAKVSAAEANKDYKSKSVAELFGSLYESTGLNAMINPKEGLMSHGIEVSTFNQGFGRVIMVIICFTLFYLAISKGFEPLLLIPIAFGGFLANIPVADIAGPEGFLGILFNMGVSTGLFPLLIFMGVGAMTDFGPLIANPKTALLGGAAQLGIFGTIVGAAVLTKYTGVIDFSLKDACAIGIIGGADGPTSIFVASRLAPDLLGAIAVAAYSYMALVPIIQPPIMRALTTKAERSIKMEQLREVSKLEKMIFPLTVMILCIIILPDATPLIGALSLGNFAKESGVVKRLSDTMENSLINIVTIFLGLSVGSKLAAEKFLVPETLGIIVLGLVAFSMGTAGGIVMAKIMNKFSKHKVNPLIGSAGVSAVPMAARVSNKEGMKEDPTNMLLMHAMGPNVAGVIGSAVAAGVLLSIFK
ncbi:MAG: sodium ion-translocating decarboxylase subunit beta [Sulfurospirillaceae bacterium]|nr:sodium ion-translocating decarboxylase subunit beta [Sulfurospirillaceae bacterium]